MMLSRKWSASSECSAFAALAMLLRPTVRRQSAVVTNFADRFADSITLDFTQKARYTLDESIVFVAIDTEADDRGRLTELGFAFLVVAELGDVAPGQHGSSWAAFLHPKHYNIAGEDGIKGNMAPKHRYCQQDPAGFNKFMQGTAETAQVDWEEARAALRNELQGWVDDGAKLVLVVHAMKNELAWLEQLDFSVAALYVF